MSDDLWEPLSNTTEAFKRSPEDEMEVLRERIRDLETRISFLFTCIPISLPSKEGEIKDGRS